MDIINQAIKYAQNEDCLPYLVNNNFCAQIYCLNSSFQQLEPYSKKSFILNQLYLDTLNEIQERVDDDTKIILLKGVSFLDRFYQRNERWMADMDLLIEENDLPTIEKILLDLGFSRWDEDHSWEANNFKIHYKKFISDIELTIEVHTKLLFNTKSYDYHTIKVNDSYHLCDTDLLAHLIGHLGNQHTYISIYWFYDIYKLINSECFRFDRKRFLKLVEKLNIKTSTSITLKVLKEHFPQSNKIDSLEDTLYTNKGRFLASFITRDFLWESPGRDLNYFILKILGKDNILESFKYVTLWFKSRL